MRESHWVCSGFEAIADRQFRHWRSGQIDRDPDAATELPPPIVTISSQLGSGGGEIADGVALALGCPLYDRDLVSAMARHAQVGEEMIETLDEKVCGPVDIWIEPLLGHGMFDCEDFRCTLYEVVESLARLGPAVIVGRGVNFLPRTMRRLDVRVVAPQAVRIARLMARLGLDEKGALAAIKTSDSNRRKFTHSVHAAEWDTMTGYDLLVDTGILPIDEAVSYVHSVWCDRVQPSMAR
jgi:cytidylate kinase